MATYQHSTTYDNGSYLKYNQVPAAGSYIGPGKTITVSGVVKNTANADKCIVLALSGWLTYYVMAYKNMTIKKNTQTAFSVSFVMTADQWQQLKYSTSNNICTIDFGLLLCPSAKTTEILGKNLANYNLNEDIFEQPTDGNSAWNMYSSANAGPTVTAPTLTDQAAVSALTAFGGMATGHSLPRVSASWAYDSHYPDQLGHAALTLTGAMAGTYEADTASGVTAAAFDLPTPAQAGTVNWTLTVTDMFGSVATATGSFAVLAYSPPTISALMPERYRVVPTSGGAAHEEADDGELIWLTLLANVAAVGGLNAWDATLTAWRAGAAEIAAVRGAGRAEDASGAVFTIASWSLSGADGRQVDLRRDEALLADLTLSAALGWRLRITITDALGNSATAVSDAIAKAGAVLDVEPHGVAVGMRSTGSAGDEKFECAWPAAFGGDVAVGAGALLKVISFQVFSGETIASQGVKTGTYTIAASDLDSNWTPVAIAGFNTDTRYAIVYDVRLPADNPRTVRYGVHNVRMSASITCAMRVYVLCVRTSL